MHNHSIPIVQNKHQFKYNFASLAQPFIFHYFAAQERRYHADDHILLAKLKVKL